MSTSLVSEDLSPHVIEAFTSSTVTVLQELAQLVAIPAERSATKTLLANDSIIAMVRLLRPMPGTMTLVLPPKTARRLAAAYLPAGTELTDEIITDVAGELTNVIAGQAKTILKGTPYHFTLSIPDVSRRARWSELRGVAITFALEEELLLMLIELPPCPEA